MGHYTIDLATCQDSRIKKIFDGFPPRTKLYINDITTDIGIPVMVGLYVSEQIGPAAAIGAAGRLSSEDAIYKTLEEVAQSIFWLRTMQESRPEYKPKPDFSDLRDFKDHCFLYGFKEMLPHLDFLRQPPKLISSPELPNRATGRVLSDINTCVELLKQKGHEVIVVDVTTPDIREVGLTVTKIIIPGLQPLDAGLIDFYHLGGERLYSVPKLLGYRNRRVTIEEFNRIPHPFP